MDQLLLISDDPGRAADLARALGDTWTCRLHDLDDEEAATGDPRRRQIEAAIVAALDAVHQLIAYLDTLDGDADLEPEAPETGAREWCGSGAHRFDVGAAA